VDALGNPVRISLTEGQRHDITQAPELLRYVRDANVIADKGYDSGALVELLRQQNCVVVIPSRNHWARRHYDRHTYKERFLVECFFQKIKRCRRIAMRFEKLAAHFLGMVTLAAALVWTL